MQDSNLIGEGSKMQQTITNHGQIRWSLPYRYPGVNGTSWAPQQRFPSASAATSLHRKDAARGSVGNPPATQAWRSSDSGETKAAKSKGTYMGLVWLGGFIMIYVDWAAICEDVCGLSGYRWHTESYRCGCAFVCKMSRDRFIWGCLKIVYPYTQWFCWSLSLLNGYNWGYTPFSDTPILQTRKSTNSSKTHRLKASKESKGFNTSEHMLEQKSGHRTI